MIGGALHLFKFHGLPDFMQPGGKHGRHANSSTSARL